jgi:plasmid stabilization system protein ParE
MAYKIVYKKRFSNKLVKLLQYLENEWNENTAAEFLNKLDKRIESLKEHPLIGKESAAKPEVRAILITKHNKLYYKFSNNKVIIMNMYDTRKNPKKNPYS